MTHGVDFDEAREHCARLATEHGYRYIHSGNEPDLIAGVGTQALEILERQPDIEVIIVPIGGGSGAAGTCIVAKAINPKVQVIGVQSAEAPAAYRSCYPALDELLGTQAVQRGRWEVSADPLARREHVVETGNDHCRCGRLGHQRSIPTER
ncbi:MAG: pyridoxal-phosphate dependent enzyme [Candidatus Dormibacteraeota bacterium]|nr:pyridoxal-phosphate dependent enzyme [Candidatus Dormibacteraeota bacterium]MDQ6884339.1 pyridoxal-phosphate dependent enzyme [Candidatus Dormibacteraeota bacterium]